MIGKSILLVDDEQSILDTYSTLLGENGFAIVTAYGGREALQLFDRRSFDLVITDLAMEEGDGFTLIDEVKDKSPHTPVIAFSGKVTESVRRYVSLLGACDLIEKPCTNERFISCVTSSLKVCEQC